MTCFNERTKSETNVTFLFIHSKISVPEWVENIRAESRWLTEKTMCMEKNSFDWHHLKFSRSFTTFSESEKQSKNTKNAWITIIDKNVVRPRFYWIFCFQCHRFSFNSRKSFIRTSLKVRCIQIFLLQSKNFIEFELKSIFFNVFRKLSDPQKSFAVNVIAGVFR